MSKHFVQNQQEITNTKTKILISTFFLTFHRKLISRLANLYEKSEKKLLSMLLSPGDSGQSVISFYAYSITPCCCIIGKHTCHIAKCCPNFLAKNLRAVLYLHFGYSVRKHVLNCEFME